MSREGKNHRWIEIWYVGNFCTFIIIAGGLMIVIGMTSIVCGLLKCRTRNYMSILDNETAAKESPNVVSESDVEDIMEENDESHS